MLEEVLKYLSVFLLSMVKFFGGPLAGVSMGLSFFETLVFTVLGMMTSVILFSSIGSAVSRWYILKRRNKQKPIFTKKSRRIVRIWQKFGISGIAFLTPILLSPIIGTTVAIVLGAKRQHIWVHMLWSAVVWGLALTFFLYKLRHLPFVENLLH